MRIALVVLCLAAVAYLWYLRSKDDVELVTVDNFDVLTDHFTLAPEAQEYIWKIERRAHHLQHELCPALEDGIRTGDAEAWERVFGGVEVDVPDGPGKERDLGFATIVRWEKGRRVPASELVRRLHGFLAPHAEIDRAHVHICDLSPKEYGQLDGPWIGSWAIELEARGKDGSRHEFASRFSITYRRMPEDPGSAEGFLGRLRLLWVEERTAARPLFEEITDRSGIEWKALRDTQRDGVRTTFPETALLDYDRDGWIDILILDPPRHYLYRGLGGGSFRDVTIEAKLLELPQPRTMVNAVTVADVDNDGFEDLLFDLRAGGLEQPVLYRNRGDGTFAWEDMAILPSPYVGSATVLDYDLDGLVDILRPNTGEPPDNWVEKARFIGDRSGRPSVLLRNRGEFLFEDVTKRTNAGAGYRDIFAAGAADLDLDGDPDVVLANHMGENVLLLNEDGIFHEKAFAHRFGGFSMGMTIGDLDGDGDADAYTANMSSRAGHRIHGNLRREDFPRGLYRLVAGFFEGDEVLRNDGPELTMVQQRTNGWTYGPGMVDVDGDGRLDLYVPAGFQSVDAKEPDG
ncbi:MAG: FG-GAP repeat domain-containing protein [Planctomycetota bacterium]|jgi:hypothetical protein